MKSLSLALSLLVLACNTNPPAPEPATSAAPVVAEPAPVPAPAPESPASTTALTLVSEPSLVCMVNNQFMGREQIPVEVDGKTYFGCCEMCKGRLARDAAARTATDPVSGKVVDKASAVIARRPNGEVLYFESKDSFERYRAL